MSAPKVIWAWPWEVNPDMGQFETKQSIAGEGSRYIRADAPELSALVDMMRSLIAMVQHAIGPGKDVFIEPDTGRKLSDARAALAPFTKGGDA